MTVLLFLCVLVLGFRNHKIKVWGIICGIIAFATNFVISPVLVLCITELLEKWYTGPSWWKLFYNHRALLLGFTLVSFAILIVMYRLMIRGIKVRHLLIFTALVNGLLFVSGLFQWIYLLASVVVAALLFLLFRKGREIWDLAIGALTLWLGVMIVVNISVPGGSYLVTWPLLFSLVAILLIFSGVVKDKISLSKSAVLAVFTIPAVLWFSRPVLSIATTRQ